MPEQPEEPVEIEITPELDLHTFQPREVSSLLEDYLLACWQKSIMKVRIIHGKGSGALRIGVHEKLARMSLVAAITWPASADTGGWGPPGCSSRSRPKTKTSPRARDINDDEIHGLSFLMEHDGGARDQGVFPQKSLPRNGRLLTKNPRMAGSGFHLRPSCIGFAGSNDRFDERHAAHSIFDFGEIVLDGRWSASVQSSTDGVGEVFVDVRKSFQVAFGVGGRGASRCRSIGSQVTIGSAIDLHWLIEPFHQQGVGLSLVPLQATFLTINADVQVVLLAHADLRTVQNALGSVVKAKQDVGIVVEQATFHKGGEICREFSNFQPRDVFRQIFSVSSNVPTQPAAPDLVGSVRQAACF